MMIAADRSWRVSGLLTGAVVVFSILAFLLLAGEGLSLAGEGTLTLAEAYRLAIENHETVKTAVEGVAQAESGVDKATSRLLPSVTATGSYTRYTEKKLSGTMAIQPDDSTTLDLKVTQSLYSGGKEWSARRQAKIGAEISRLGLDAAKEHIILATANAYFGVLKARKDVEIKDAALKRARERARVADANFKAGTVTKTAVLRAEAEAAGAEAELTRAGSRLLDADNSLRRLIGGAGEVNVDEPARQALSDTGVEELVKTALEHRRAYKQSVLDEKAAGEAVSYAKGNFLPSLSLVGEYTHKDQDPQTTFYVENSTSASVVLTYPIFEGGLRRAELSEARSRFRESELRRLGLKRDIEVEVREAYNNRAAVRAVIDSYEKQKSFAEEDYRMVFEQYKWGLATTLDVIDADTTLISAQRSLMNARYDLELASLQLKYSTGTLLEEVLKMNGEGGPGR
ncbi:MAG: TolC family outer membrane protein [Deltaproteobacteria bacterium]|nr:TolC family outer membrane protein [Deltaproteobacteria bacterium]